MLQKTPPGLSSAFARPNSNDLILAEDTYHTKRFWRETLTVADSDGDLHMIWDFKNICCLPCVCLSNTSALLPPLQVCEVGLLRKS